MGEAEGFDVFLGARRYNPLVPPEPVPLQVQFHSGEQVLNLFELWLYDFRDLLAVSSPLVHNVVEERDKPL